MDSKCEECNKWNKHWYWTHLEPTQIRFSRLLTAGFDQRLVVPRKIVYKFREQLVETATLKSLNGKAWTIGLQKRDEDLFFQEGWADFVRDHSLKEGDILTFQYEEDSTFIVSMFDSESGYEKVGSYSNHGLPTNLETREANVHEGNSRKCSSYSDDSSDDDDESNGYQWSMNNTSDDSISLETGRSDHGKASQANKYIVLDTESEDERPSRKKARKTGRSSRTGLPSTSSKGKSVCKEPNSRDTGTRIFNLDKSYPTYLESGRRPVAQAEKDKAYKSAHAFRSSEPSFIVTMLQTHVCKRFFMTIPKEFVKAHIPRRVKEVILRVGVKTWLVKYNGQRSYGVGLSGGWMNFVWDNNLEEGDVCVFQLAQPSGNEKLETIAMDVKIFRVVKKLTQLKKVSRCRLIKEEEGNASQ